MDGLQSHNEPLPDPMPLAPRSNTSYGLVQHASIRTGVPADLKFIDSLQRKYGKQLGFMPRAALEYRLAHGEVQIVLENDEPAGYFLGPPKLGWQPKLRPIFQAAVAMDAQRRHLGLHLLRKITQDAIAAGTIGLQANCAVGVEANEFWKAAGFIPICHLSPPTKRARDIICWRKPLIKKLPLWFAMPPERHGYRARKTSTEDRCRKRSKDVEFAKRFISAAPRTWTTLPDGSRPLLTAPSTEETPLGQAHTQVTNAEGGIEG